MIDPHTDLVDGLLRHVPESLVDRVRLIDLADDSQAPGINLLDTRIFSDRDRTADSVVRVAKGLWDQWGPRMQSILEGGVLLVSTSQGTAGRDVAALVGASLLNLVDSVIREQGGMPLEERRGVLVVVDEMQSMPGVDYETMLSELGKFGRHSSWQPRVSPS